jgi:glucose/arabinose dehydrogenase
MGTAGGHGAEGGAGEGMSWAALKLLHAGEDGSLLQPLACRSREGATPWLAEERKGSLCVAVWEEERAEQLREGEEGRKKEVAARGIRGVGMENFQICKGEGSYL